MVIEQSDNLDEEIDRCRANEFLTPILKYIPCIYPPVSPKQNDQDLNGLTGEHLSK